MWRRWATRRRWNSGFWESAHLGTRLNNGGVGVREKKVTPPPVNDRGGVFSSIHEGQSGFPFVFDWGENVVYI